MLRPAATAAVFFFAASCGGVAVEAAELCANDFDDDGDGRVDCDDESCAFADACSDCGDGVVDDGEACDDGNRADGDGCSARCVDEDCDDPRGCVPVSARCGDRVLQPEEGCDDGNRDSGDGCDATCRGEAGFCAANPNGVQCNDGNATAGDGCSPSCLFEFCGDGIVQPTLGERCDDAAPGAGVLGCSGCQIPVCGNFRIENGEVCDDGNTRGGDGCSANCRDFN